MKKTLLNLVSVLGGEAMIRLANFAAALVIARVHGASVLGLYATCLAVITIAVTFADNGLQTAAITELTSLSSKAEQKLGELYLAKIILTVIVMVLLFAVGVHQHFDRFVWMIAVLVAVRTVVQSYSQLQMAILKSQGRMHGIGLIQGAHALILIAGIGVAITRGWPVSMLLGWLVFGQCLEAALATASVFRTGIRARWPGAASSLALVLRSTPFGLMSAFANLIARLDTIILSTLVALPELGQFSAADTLLLIVYVASWLFGSVVLPEMVQRASLPILLREFVNKWVRLISLAVIPSALLAFWLAPKLAVSFYGQAFAPAGAIISVMMIACPLIFLNSLYANLAIAIGLRALCLRVFAATTIVTIGLNYFFGRAFGPIGIAAAIVVREFVMLAGFWMLSLRLPAETIHLDATAPS